MSSRGAKAKNGHVTTTEYETKRMVGDAKVLVGKTSNQHGLPDYSHSPNRIYIKENPDGSFREMRVYDSEGSPLLEIAYHPEPSLGGNRHTYILHYHILRADLSRGKARRLSKDDSPEIYEKYKVYLKEYGL
ncbi:MAG: hypothetical protein J6Y08_07900 [Clostridiales bacterium]|nr:hypothetical protein [Clostridiales bacterium]